MELLSVVYGSALVHLLTAEFNIKHATTFDIAVIIENMTKEVVIIFGNTNTDQSAWYDHTILRLKCCSLCTLTLRYSVYVLQAR